MKTKRAAPQTIDDYIAASVPDVQTVLKKIRSTIQKAAPGAAETISYRIPAFTQNGIVVYFAAFKNHIGLYPPVTGDARLVKAASPYAGEKGNLRFPLDQPIPYSLIGKIAKFKAQQNRAKAAAAKKPNRPGNNRTKAPG